MNITFNNVSGQKDGFDSFSGMEVERESRSLKSEALSTKTSYRVDLESSLFGNEAYAHNTKTTDEISEMAQNTDVKWQHNYMALLSNTLSEEDYAKAAEDGFDLKSLNGAETVTILDKIKSVLLESGKVVTGYNDDLSIDKLAKITGSRAFAEAIQKSFHENDLPITRENVKEAKQAYEQVSDITALDQNALKYMVLNSMEPTIENIYMASHSTNGMNMSARGYYAQDAGGYYAQKADSFNWEQLNSQIEKIIEQAGLDNTSQEVKDEARWIVEQGIPLTSDNLERTHKLNEIQFPLSIDKTADAIGAALLDGKNAVSADVTKTVSNAFMAKEILEKTNEISDGNIKDVIANERLLNLSNLFGANENTSIADNDTRFLEARLNLEEVRLKMTYEANKALLDSDFKIDIAPIEDLIKNLQSLITNESAFDKSQIIEMTMSRVETISKGPAAVVGQMLGKFNIATLTDISASSTLMASRYKKAGEAYEPLMTAPRADLGDSIKKAFGNIDEILEEIQEEVNDDNRRAVRILGYNRLEINKKSVEEVKGWDQLLRSTIDRIKPGAILDLIKEGKNPLKMTLEELSYNLDQSLFNGQDGEKNGNDKSKEKYSRFLYKLEKKGDITEKEKQSFIGIYRLFHNLKKDDYKAIGSVLKTGQEMTLKNLLDATRIQKRAQSKMDYTVDDDFGGLGTKGDKNGLKIDEQINLAFRFYSAKADIVYENLEPEKLQIVQPNENTLLPDLANDLQNAKTDEQITRDYYRQQAEEVRQTLSGREAKGALDEILERDITVSFSNLEAMIGARRDRRSGSIWQKTVDVSEKEALTEQQLLVDALLDDDYVKTYQKSLERMSEKLSDVLMNEDDTYIDVRSINLMQKQLSVMSQSSEKGSFEVPVEVDGQKISMHITLLSEEGMNSRMEASVQTYEYGLVTASLYVQDGIVNGMLTTTNANSSEESEYLEGVRTKLCDKMAEKLKGLGINQERIAILYHAQTRPASPGRVNANATDGNLKENTDTKVFLTMAKAFIEAL